MRPKQIIEKVAHTTTPREVSTSFSSVYHHYPPTRFSTAHAVDIGDARRI